jgi:magnesium transporter
MSESVEQLTADVTNKPEHSSIMAAYLYVSGQEPRALRIDQVGAALLRPDALVWIGLHNPPLDILQAFTEQLGLGSELCSDLTGEHSHPRFTDYDENLLLIAQSVQMETDRQRPHFGTIRFVLGQRFLFTVRTGPSPSHADMRTRLEKMRHRIDRGCDHILVDLLNGLLDHYAEIYKGFERRVDRTERALIKVAMNRVSIQQLYMLRRDFHRFHNAIEPLGEVCARLARLKLDPIAEHTREHFLALSRRIESMDRLFSNLSDDLSFAFEAGMLIEQARQTDTTRKLAAWAAIIAIPTAVAGIYGMNFENMPELKFKYGYYMVLGLMATACGTLYALFRRAKWL